VDRAAIEVKGLGVRIGGSPIVDGLDLEARRGEIIAVIGPNGAGKTTLLEAIVGVRRKAAGRVIVGGTEVTTFSQSAASFSYMPDDAILPPEVRVDRLMRQGRPTSRRTRATEAKLVPLLGLESLRNRFAGMLSRGERKRVTLFGTLVLERPIVVLDEPFSAFDPLQLGDVFAAIRAISAEGSSVIVSIHQLTDAERIGDRFLLMAQGRRIAFGTLAELRDRIGEEQASLETIFLRILAEERGAAA
jgi:ABC-type multidrug transport system ATPase subunit